MAIQTIKISQETRNVLASMAIEEMYFDNDFLSKITAVEKGELTYDDLRREIIQEYAGQ